MFERFTSLGAAVTAALLLGLGSVEGRAEAPKFARGFVIYKKVPSDQPAYYGGTLFLESKQGPVWLEYDLGQKKPFFLARDLFVNEIKFGALFEADFTTDKHVEFCRSVQGQLAAAARQSPQLAAAANAASKAIQAEVDHYEKGLVRVKGRWIERDKYLAETNAVAKAQEKTRMDMDAANAASEKAMKAKMAETRAAAKELEKNLYHAYVSVAAQNQVMHFNDFIKSATAALSQQAMPVRMQVNLAEMIRLPMSGGVTPMLQLVGKTEEDTTAAVIYAFNEAGNQLLAADVIFFMEAPADGRPLIPKSKAEVGVMKQFLDQFDGRIFDCIPDAIAAAQIMGALKDAPPSDRSTPFSRSDIQGYHVRIHVYPSQTMSSRYLRMLLVEIRPAA